MNVNRLHVGMRSCSDLTTGGITSSMLLFAFPMIVGNMLQQLYNIVDMVIVGRCVGSAALAAVGSSYTLTVFLTSVVLGLCMGCGALFSNYYGASDYRSLRRGVFISFVLTGGVTLVLGWLSFAFLDDIMSFMRVPADVWQEMYDYLLIVLSGVVFVFVYNYSASLARAVGNSVAPLLALAVSMVLNIGLDLLLVMVFDCGVKGAAVATVVSQVVSAVWLCVYVTVRLPYLIPRRKEMVFNARSVREIIAYSSLTCAQQSVMNFGILLVQGLVNSFGAVVMAAFAVAVKIDSFAYMPVQDFGNAFSTFVAQNFGAGRRDRIGKAVRSAVVVSLAFCVVISLVTVVFADTLMMMFVSDGQDDIIAVGVGYLRREGPFYFAIGWLFLLYGYYRAIGRPAMSLVLTVISLGVRVGLSYGLSAVPSIGVDGIWWSIPAGWLLADGVGLLCGRATLRGRGDCKSTLL